MNWGNEYQPNNIPSSSAGSGSAYTPSGDTTQVLQGDGTTLSKTALPISTATQAALDTKQAALGFTPENTANKSTSTADSASTVKFPVWSAVLSYVTGLGYLLASTAASTYQTALGFTPENVANKSTDGTLSANSDTNYPSQKAVKTYADTKQAALGFTPENTANKSTSTADSASTVKFPVWSAVVSYVTGLGYLLASTAASTYQTALGFTPENVANKSTDGTLSANSDTNYPSQKAVKTYADTKQAALGFTPENTANKSTSTADSASTVKFPVWSTVVSYVTGLGYLLSSTAASTYQAILTSSNFGTFVNSLTAKTTPVDADLIDISDSAASNAQKKVTLTNFKAYLKTYLDTLYISLSTALTGLSLTDNSQITSSDNVVSAAGKLQVQINSITFKQFVQVATTANITLSGTQTIDGVAVTVGTRVLVKNQTTAANNGIYVVAAGAWTRATDANTAALLLGAKVTVISGNTNSSLSFQQTEVNITLGTTAIAWSTLTIPQGVTANHPFADTTSMTFVNGILVDWQGSSW